MTRKTLKEIQEMVFEEYKKNGYLIMWSFPKVNLGEGFYNYKHYQNINDIAELGLINTEVSEAIEITRKKDNKNKLRELALECADIIIRTLNFMSRKGLDAEFYIIAKHNKNMKRGLLHGKEI